MTSKWLDLALASALVPVLLACGLLNPYSPGAITRAGDVEEAAVRRGACIDIGFALSGRWEISPLQMLTRFGNRCRDAAPIDLARLEIHAEYADHIENLYIDDPRNEVVPLHVETSTMGTERFKLGPMGDKRPLRVCIGVNAAIEAPSAPPICFAPGPESWEVVQ